MNWWLLRRLARPSRAAWPSSPPPIVAPIGPPTFTDQPVREPRMFTQRHADLLVELAAWDETNERAGPMWSVTALLACLQRLQTSTVTETWCVAVEDAWVDGPDAFCVVYRPPFDYERTVGVRRRRQDAIEPGEWRLGDMTTWGYEIAPDGPVDPTMFAWNVADFDIGEPLGFVATVLRFDRQGVGWWGNLDTDTDLPRRPVRPPRSASG